MSFVCATNELESGSFLNGNTLSLTKNPLPAASQTHHLQY